MDWSPIISSVQTYGAALLSDVAPVLYIVIGLPLAFLVAAKLKGLFFGG